MPRRAARVLIIASGCALALTGCAPGGGGAVHLVQVGRQTDGTTAHIAVHRVAGDPAGSIEWTTPAVDPASTTVAMAWVDGAGPECGEADSVQVVERRDAVVVGITAPEQDSDTICAASGVLRRFELHLARPLGGRALLEPATGIDDGLPVASTGLPRPTCSTDAALHDVPAGMPDAARRIAPIAATTAVVCRTAWPHGVARSTMRRIGGTEVRRLVAMLNVSTDQGPPPGRACTRRSSGAWYAVTLLGPGVQVEVFLDEFDCDALVNGARVGTATPAARALLAGFFRS